MNIIDRAKLMYSRQGATGIALEYEKASAVDQAKANLYRMRFPTNSGLSPVLRFQQAILQDLTAS